MKEIATAILCIHLLWIAAVIIGAAFTRGRPVWTALHVASLLWGIIVEVLPITCPLTMAEQYFETRAGLPTYHGSFLMHYLDAIIYPNLPWWLVATVGVLICALNLGIYGWRFIVWIRAKQTAQTA
ncbi:MAG TPA: DUF2784 domain-containing protein [Acidobacteriaceae bacterium]|nr:DUF2784 domain-containing protein [Acidobacteriaceae bacterium]